MAITEPIKHQIRRLKAKFDRLKKGKSGLLRIINEAEVIEQVFNSNAIENSTLSLKETEQILLQMEVARNTSLREVFEAKNLSTVLEYIQKKATQKVLTPELILLLHKMLISNIDDTIAGRFRQKNEWVRVGNHIAPAPEHVGRMIEAIFNDYNANLEDYFVDKIARFHLDLETIHPFCDGNGRIGRVIINYQLFQLDLPPIIIRNKEKQAYYKALREYNHNKNTKLMEKIVSLAVMETLNKRITYLRGDEIINLTDAARKHKKTTPSVLNAAKRQNIPAFRERGVWKIGISEAI